MAIFQYVGKCTLLQHVIGQHPRLGLQGCRRGTKLSGVKLTSKVAGSSMHKL